MNVKFRQILLMSGDIFLLYLSLLLALFLKSWGGFNWEVFLNHLPPFSILYFFWLIIFYIFGFYDLHLIKTKISFYPQALRAIFLNLFLGIGFFYTIPFFGITPKTNLFLNGLIFLILFILWRNLFYSLLPHLFLNRTTIVGRGNEIENLKKEISQRPYLGYKLIEIDLEKDFLPQIKEKNIDTVIFTKEYEISPKLLRVFCLPVSISFLDFTRAYEIITEKIPISMISRSWFLENLREKEKGFYDKLKRTIDIALSSLLLLLTFPLWPFIAIAIKLEDGGPIFYSQERVGKNKKIFKLIKFRSMISEAEKEGPKWAEVKDERVTKVGKILRRIHLDEFPQMLNVIIGDISLVGPRPERPEFVEKLEKEVPYYHVRHLIKPGFTGWAQIKFRYGRSVMDSFEKSQYDLYYLKNRSIFLDLRILLKTFQLFFKKE